MTLTGANIGTRTLAKDIAFQSLTMSDGFTEPSNANAYKGSIGKTEGLQY